MGRRIPEPIRRKVLREWLEGRSRQTIARDNQIVQIQVPMLTIGIICCTIYDGYSLYVKSVQGSVIESKRQHK
jgi:hypothetical protein